MLISFLKGLMDHKQPFNKRASDNTSEEKFEEFCKDKNIIHFRYGTDQRNSGISGKDFIKIPKIIRNTPDYIVIKKTASFIEVKGCKDFARMKLKDLESYDFWNKLMKLYYCIYSVTFNEMRFISHVALKNLVKGCNIKQFHDFTPYDKKEYYEIPFKEL